MDWRTAATRRGLRMTDMAEHVGTLVEGVDLSEPLDNETRAMLRAACSERVALLFRGQQHVMPAHTCPSPRGSAAIRTCIRSAITACRRITRSSSWATWRKAARRPATPASA